MNKKLTHKRQIRQFKRLHLTLILIILISSLFCFAVFNVVNRQATLSRFSDQSGKNSDWSEFPASYHDYIKHSGDWIFGNFVITNHDRCQTEGDFQILLLVNSSPEHVYRRTLLRRYVTSSYRIVFLFGLRDSQTNSRIISESEQYGDIVQGNFIDSYNNLTRKHIMGLTWAALYCSNARWIHKSDDDVSLNFTSIHLYLEQQFSSNLLYLRTRLMLGLLQAGGKPKRSVTDKWYISHEEYSPETFPPYLSGLSYITTLPVIRNLLGQVLRTPTLWIDDLYVTGVLRSKVEQIILFALNQFYSPSPDPPEIWLTMKGPYKWPFMIAQHSSEVNQERTFLRIESCKTVNCLCCLPNFQDRGDNVNETGLVIIPTYNNRLSDYILND